MRCQGFKLFSKLLSNRPAFKTKQKNATCLFIQNTQYSHLLCAILVNVRLFLGKPLHTLILSIDTPRLLILYNMCTRQYMLQVTCLSETNVKDITSSKPRLYYKHITQSVHNLTTHLSTTATHGDPCVYD